MKRPNTSKPSSLLGFLTRQRVRIHTMKCYRSSKCWLKTVPERWGLAGVVKHSPSKTAAMRVSPDATGRNFNR